MATTTTTTTINSPSFASRQTTILRYFDSFKSKNHTTTNLISSTTNCASLFSIYTTTNLIVDSGSIQIDFLFVFISYKESCGSLFQLKRSFFLISENLIQWQ